MIKIKSVVALIALMGLLNGCSYFKENNTVAVPYNNGTTPALKNPPGMNVETDTLYPIPQKTYPADQNQVNITPPGLDGEVPKRS